MRYFINPHFCLDDGTRKGVNVQLYADDDIYFMDEKPFDTMTEAMKFVEDLDMVPCVFDKTTGRPLCVDPLNYCPTNPKCK